MPERTHSRWRDPVRRRRWVLLGLCVALSAIGFVQFRWIDEVARAQREHAVAALHASVARFTSDFDTEIARIHFTFQVPVPRQSAETGNAQYRLRKWRELAPYPRLISEVKEMEPDRSRADAIFMAGRPQLPAGVAFVTGSRVAGVSSEHRPEGFAFGTGAAPPPGAMVFRTQGGVGVSPGLAFELGEAPEAGAPRDLAMVMPLMPGMELITRGRGRPGMAPMPIFTSSVRIIFDREYIEREFIPKLVDNAFPEQKSEVQILISGAADPSRIVWKSEPDGYAAHQAADLTAPFFALRPGCLGNAMFGEAFGPADPVRMQEGILRQVLGQRTAACEQQPLDRPAGNWKISVRYRAGSVDAVISRFRYRSLGLSLGVLSVLFLAAVMLVVSTERARSLAKVQMEFAAGVSHELRTPLSAIRVAADNLSQGLVQNETQARRYGAMIVAQVKHLAALVSDVLLFSHTEASLEIPGIEAVSVELIVEDAISSCAADLEPAGVEIKRDLRLPLPDVLASRHLVTQCLVNIIQNAIKYARAGKFIGIEAAACDSSAVAGVRIDIVDRGPGIPQDELSHVFEPFYRGREARSSQTSGLGLGLSIVRRIVAGHRGHVKVFSQPNSHTRFSIWLPAAGLRPGSEVGGRAPEADAVSR